MSTPTPLAGHSTSRVIAYVDGFNLYYGIRAASRDADAKNRQFGGDASQFLGRSLYWLDIPALIQRQLLRSQQLVAVKYFSAPRIVPKLVKMPSEYLTDCLASNHRQQVFLNALSTNPLVSVVLGKYTEKQPFQCRDCPSRRPAFEEKMTDVNLAVHMVCDAYEDRADHAVLMAGDNDFVEALHALKRLGKSTTVLFPPGRKSADHLKQAASETRAIEIRSLRSHQLPDRIHRNGLPPIERPAHWMPPGQWIWDA